MMKSIKPLVLLVPVMLAGCSVLGSGQAPYSPLEARYSGSYEGILKGLTGESAARLVLDVSEKDGSAAGVPRYFCTTCVICTGVGAGQPASLQTRAIASLVSK